MLYSAEVILALGTGLTSDLLNISINSISVPNYQNCHEVPLKLKRKARNMTHVCLVETTTRIKITFRLKALYFS